MKRRQKRKIVLLALLFALLLALGAWFWNFRVTGSVAIPDLQQVAGDVLEQPTYMFSFSGSGANQLVNPLGVLAYKGEVFVTDSQAGKIEVFNQIGGTYIRTFQAGHLTTPLYLALNPKDGNIYVTDRRRRSVEVFTVAGTWVRTFNPQLPKSELPSFSTDGVQWAPVAITFAPDGTMYVTELLNGHRMLIFGPDGKFVRSVGKYGVAGTALDLPGQFQFPNSVKVYNNMVYVVDSNNHRVQTFKKDGTYDSLIAMSGLPRGMAFLPMDLTQAGAKGKPKFVIVDTLTHNATIWDTDGSQLLSFGQQGNADGSFNYPTDVALGDRDVLFITDSLNRRVQAWGWQSKISPLPKILPRAGYWYLLLLLLPLLPLFFRRRKLYATADFVQKLYDEQALKLMDQGRVRWFVSEADYELIKGLEQDDVAVADIVRETTHSETDAYALAQRFHLSDEDAARLAFAQQAKLIHTEDVELTRQARLIEVDTMDADEFIKQASAKAAKGTGGAA